MPATTYRKVPFEWAGDVAPADSPLPAGWCWSAGSEAEPPVGVVASTLSKSPDASDRHAVETLGAERAAQRLLELTPGFSYLPSRWQVLEIDGEAAGYVLPVIYDGCARDGLDESTIYHIGVAPAHRGGGVGRLLLRHAMRVFQRHGVWRVICDTAVTNEPMIRLFETEGWTRLPARERPIFEI